MNIPSPGAFTAGSPLDALGRSGARAYCSGMLRILRFVGLLNAAVWLGGCVFFTFAAAPAIFQPGLKRLFHDYYIGVIAQFMQERYFTFQVVCGAVALAHAVVEWLLRRHEPWRSPPWLLAGLLALSLAGRFWFHPYLKALHEIRYSAPTAAQQAEARATFRKWHGLSQALNLLLLGGLVWHLWRRAAPDPDPRLRPARLFGGLTNR
jgi:hypothetical protein